jgi:hypothetical protein
MPNIVEKGNPLTTPLIQAGWNIVGDGYGLITSTTKYKCDHTVDLQGFVLRGQPHPDPAYSFLKVHKYNISWESLGIAVVSLDYVGIDPSFNSGNHTNPEVASSNGLTSENITTNQNFFVEAFGGSTYAIAGQPPYTQSPIGPLVEIKSPTDYITVTTGSTVVKVNKKQSYMGLNGACFEDATGGRFIGFVKPEFRHFYGKTNYLAPQSSFSGHFYTTQQDLVSEAIFLLGTTSFNNTWNSNLPKIVPDYAGPPAEWISNDNNGNYNQLLLSQVNIQDFGSLYKVNYEVRFSIQGWPSEVYQKVSTLP